MQCSEEVEKVKFATYERTDTGLFAIRKYRASSKGSGNKKQNIVFFGICGKQTGYRGKFRGWLS
jgi:hypothetical protein